MVLLLNRQGRFKGDLNILQQMALAWVMTNESTREMDLEKLRATNMGLATNPATSKDFLTSMMKDLQGDQEIEYITDKGWTTPQSVDEIENFLRSLPQ